MALRRRIVLASFLALCGAAPAARAEWSTNGLPLCTAPRAQYCPALVAGSAGSALAAWLDLRTGYNVDVYAQRVMPEGRLAAGWAPNGDSLSHITCTKSRLRAVTDGAGGAFVAWADDRCRDTTGINLYLHRITPSGAVATGWSTDGMAVTTALHEQWKPALTPDGAGGVLVAWQDQRDARSDIYAARLLGSGEFAPGWPAGGLLVATATNDTAGPVITADGAGGAFIAWTAKPGASRDIQAQHLTGAGLPASGWPTGGITVCAAAGDQLDPLIEQDGAAGAVVVWTDLRGGPADVFGQRIADPPGVGGWQANGLPLCTESGDQRVRSLAPDGAGGMLVAWEDGGNGNGWDIGMMRLAASGAPAPGWPSTGLRACGAPGDQTDPALVADGGGGAFVAWTDARAAGSNGLDVYVQHVADNGAVAEVWPADGFALASSPNDQRDPRMCSDGAGGAYAVWIDRRDDATSGADVWAHRVAPEGPVPTSVRDLAAFHRDGQTFITWTCPPGTDWTYRIYASDHPIASSADLLQAAWVGTVGDSTWCDRRLSGLLNTVYGYCLDSLGPMLAPTQGLFVRTAPLAASVYYAGTAQWGACTEDRAVHPGADATITPLSEIPALPRPVWQRQVMAARIPVEVYTLWTSRVDTPFFPAMGNRDDQAYDCGLVRGGPPPSNSALVRCHWKNASFLNVAGGTGMSGEWVLALDDPLPNWDHMTFWYGYHPGYDTYANIGVPPTSGGVVDYTLRRILYTTLWLRRSFAVDTTRVYSLGYSMGGIGTNLLLFARPDLFAAALSVISRFDFSHDSDPDTLNSFNAGRYLRTVADREWGTIATNLTCSDGRPVYERLNLGFMAGAIEPQAVPPLITMNGKYDEMVGWAEKIDFYRGMGQARQGGTFFWDQREHTSPAAAWFPMQDARYLYRFRTDRSFPALSHCSADHDPGDGTATSGDSVGTINGFVEWDTSLVDHADRWETTLRLRELSTLWGPMPAPESLTVDVTPRRTQNFHVFPNQTCSYRVVRLADGVVVQSGEIESDSLGRLTVEQVKVHRTGSRMELDYSSVLGAGGTGTGSRLTLALSRNPVRGRADLVLHWPPAGEGRVELFDVHGRLIRRLWHGPAQGAPARLAFETAGLPGGLYFVMARTEATRSAQRVIVLR